MWKIGDRVLAHRSTDVFWYPGTIRHIDGERFYVIFEDGEDAFVRADQINEGKFEVQDQVHVHNPSVGEYLQGRVQEVGEIDLLVRFSNGNEQQVELSKVRVHPETWKSRIDFEEEKAPAAWSVCDRVLACGPDLHWYPGIILNVEGERIYILFDNGEQLLLPPSKIRPLQLHTGDQVTCRWRAGPDYLPGRITSIEGEKVEVSYDDGFVETTSVRLVRLSRDEWFISNSRVNINTGQRVLAQWYDLNWYPGVIVSVDGRRLQIAYFDGDQAYVTPDQVRELDIGVGSRVWCRPQDQEEYRPGEIIDQQGESVRIKFDDGNTEWTTLRKMRLEHEENEQ